MCAGTGWPMGCLTARRHARGAALRQAMLYTVRTEGHTSIELGPTPGDKVTLPPWNVMDPILPLLLREGFCISPVMPFLPPRRAGSCRVSRGIRPGLSCAGARAHRVARRDQDPSQLSWPGRSTHPGRGRSTQSWPGRSTHPGRAARPSPGRAARPSRPQLRRPGPPAEPAWPSRSKMSSRTRVASA